VCQPAEACRGEGTHYHGSHCWGVLSELVQQNPPIGVIILENGKLRQHIVVTVNGHNTIDLETPATEQDVLAIFPPIASG